MCNASWACNVVAWAAVRGVTSCNAMQLLVIGRTPVLTREGGHRQRLSAAHPAGGGVVGQVEGGGNGGRLLAEVLQGGGKGGKGAPE